MIPRQQQGVSIVLHGVTAAEPAPAAAGIAAIARRAPFVSVIVLNHGRPARCRRVLESVIAQTYRNREIIIVDNESAGQLRPLVNSLGPNVVLVELGENAGASGGRNAGIRRARGEIIVTLDDDVLFASPTELAAAVKVFAACTEVGVLAFRVCLWPSSEISIRDWCHPRPYRQFADAAFDTYFFIEGAAAYRRSAFAAAGLYDERIFLYGEGHDLALRILDSGMKIRYTPAVRVWHLRASSERASEKPYYFHTRNYIWIACKDYPLLGGARFLPHKLAMMSFFALRTGMYRPFLRGLWDGIAGLPRVWRKRTPASRSTLSYMSAQDRLRPGLLERLARHKHAPQL